MSDKKDKSKKKEPRMMAAKVHRAKKTAFAKAAAPKRRAPKMRASRAHAKAAAPRAVFLKRFATIEISPLDGELREKLVRSVVEFGNLALARGVKIERVASTLKQKAFETLDMYSTLHLLKEKGLLQDKPKADAPKPR